MPSQHPWQKSAATGHDPFAPETVTAVARALQQLHASLGADEQAVLETVLGHAAADGGAARADRVGDKRSIIFVGGRDSGPIRLGVDSGAPLSARGPVPPGIFSSSAE